MCGALVAWLFAPEKGSSLRAKIKKDRREGNLGLAPLKHDVTQTIKDVTATAKEIFNDEIDLVKELYRQNQRQPVHFDKHPLKKRSKGKADRQKNSRKE